MQPTDKEIYAQIDRANIDVENGTSYGGMSYEEGVKAALEWILGGAPRPMNDEEEEKEYFRF